jgi:hypothetical protein
MKRQTFVTEASLAAFFSSFGPVHSVRVNAQGGVGLVRPHIHFLLLLLLYYYC